MAMLFVVTSEAMLCALLLSTHGAEVDASEEACTCCNSDHTETEVMQVVTVSGEAAAECQCPDCAAQVEAVRLEMQTKLDKTIQELDEIIEERNRQFEEIKRLKHSLQAARQEQENAREALQSVKAAREGIQQRLLGAQAQISTLQGELDAAKGEVQRLSELSFIVQFKKEVTGLFDSIGEFTTKQIFRQ